MNDPPTNLIRHLRALVPERRLSFAEALRIAELQANVLRERLGIDQAELPETAIEDLPRISVQRRHGLPVSGLTHWHNGRWLIVINADESYGRQRFSLAHELKHVLDHAAKDRCCWSEPGLSAQKKAERLADYFAGCLPVPRRHLKAAWGRQPDVQAVANAFGVSVPAARVRASQVGLIPPTPRCLTPRATWQHFGSTYFRSHSARVAA